MKIIFQHEEILRGPEKHSSCVMGLYKA